jgi:multidrug efflux pump subunit AcrA (membrane-fusion protein)
VTAIRIIPGALVIPSAAVARQGGGTYLFRATGDRAHRIPVHLGIESGNDVEVLEGLTPTEAVLLPAAPSRKAPRSADPLILPEQLAPAGLRSNMGNGRNSWPIRW